MRNTRVMALVVASLVSSAAVVQAQGGGAMDRAPQAGRGLGRGMEGGRNADGLFRGVKLSDAEKAGIKTVHEKFRTQMRELAKAQRPAMEEIRALREKGDTAGARAAVERTKGNRDRMRALMDQERSEIRGVLSAENRAAFDANVGKLDERRAEWEKGREGKGGQAGKAGKGRRGSQGAMRGRGGRGGRGGVNG